MKISNCEQGTPEWAQIRCGIATASCFDAVLAQARDKKGEAVTRRNYRARLVVERLTGRPVEGGFENYATRQGIEREPLARLAYEAATGNLVQRVGFIRHDTIEAGCSPDGIIGSDGATEFKCPDISTHIEYLMRADEPPAYRPQVQGVLWLAERQWCDFVSFNPDFPERLQLVIRRVQRNVDYTANLEMAVRLFMDEVRTDEAVLRALPQAAEYEAA